MLDLASVPTLQPRQGTEASDPAAQLPLRADCRRWEQLLMVPSFIHGEKTILVD